MNPTEITQHPVLTMISTIASIAATIVAFLVIAAWWSGEIVLASMTPGYVPMTPSIAISVSLLAGAAIIGVHLPLRSPWRRMAAIMAILVLLLSFWVVFDFAAGPDLDIDKILGSNEGTVGGYSLEEPSPISTVTLLAASLAATLSFNEKIASGRRVAIPALSLFVFSVGILITLGYAYGSPLLYGGDVRPVSVLAGISYSLVGIALMCLQNPPQWPVSAFVGPSVRARLLRAFVPLIVLLVLISGSLSNRALSTSGNPALTASLIALVTATVVGLLISRLSARIGGQIDKTNSMLLETQNELKKANEKLNVLGSITRHDTLNRLAVIQGRLELLQESTKDKEILKQTRESLAAAQAIEEIIQFTGEYQKIGVGGPVWVDVEDAFREALIGVDPETILIKSEVLGLDVLADRMFRKVLANLVDNSLRHGKDLKNLKLHYRMNDSGLTLVYEDDGGGLADDEKMSLFERGHGKHTGLGMFLSKEILEFSGMSIHETGERGVGARFEIMIPADKFRFRTR